MKLCQKPKILIVEDKLGMQKILSYAVEQLAYEPIVVATASEAIARAEEAMLLILDMRLAEQTDGEDVILALNGRPLAPTIVVVTAYPELLERARMLGVRYTMDKADYTEEDFKKLIERAMQATSIRVLDEGTKNLQATMLQRQQVKPTEHLRR